MGVEPLRPVTIRIGRRKQYVLIQGNVIDGLCIYGPFEDIHDAIAFKEKWGFADWMTYELLDPEDEPKG